MTATINPSEAEHFGRLAAEWWDPHGSSAMLHRLNPARLGYIRRTVDAHWHLDAVDRRPLAGRRVLDVGCGAGLITEPLARLGGDVTGVDAAAANIDVARQHAAGQGLDIRYCAGDIADPGFADQLGLFDLVTALEVIEHVTDPRSFLTALRARMAPGALLILSTPNRTAASRLLLVKAAERVGMVPAGTHDWHCFITPDELGDLAQDVGLQVTQIDGIMPDMGARGFRIGPRTDLNYLAVLVRSDG